MEPGGRASVRDKVAVEEPMEMRVEFGSPTHRETRSVAVTMRTPGNDFELAAGFLFAEGILPGREAVQEITYCQKLEDQEYNIVTLSLRDGVGFDEEILDRNFFTTSSCGVCGKASLESVTMRGCAPLPTGGLTLEASLIPTLPELLLENQKAFRSTGGLHAAGLFNAQGDLLSIREDVGRHNAVDKVIGHALLENEVPLAERVLVVSGRTSFEILQKAVNAGIPALVAVGAPSTLAVDTARAFNLTLAGFARGERFNLYAGEERVMDWSSEGGG